MTSKVSKSIGAIVVNDQHDVLLLFRTFQRFWEFPKEKPHPGESEDATLRRGLKEEIGVEKFEFIQPFREEVYFDFQLGDEMINRQITYFAVHTNDSIKISEEHSQVGWFTFEKAKERLQFDNYRRLVDKLQTVLPKSPFKRA
ncbi:MAG: hypothetical protein A2898_03020 [Candidatus Kerfeldbacteria bacterium RIFCSPLOWO2_01_FULL_48_11]|uniref:Nudix hydrolase domain-containing protein n=1 Tax=Candidatus Kerfeldbacteria bacterium RIFCSPLOWO2_01_FULL_48_11 TaxID=1798543 RepID=A0A1G2B5L8_9BACT|nr:MAG: NUDIX hydrolase [Parcubacteria group bacterium GW2011_GWA2_48_9]OGY84275.1 MAG: hypothetical protein A2898_03020 [Candidatus Kerfeldbacteria bacterium RIFCSPLOWO2_01_FULL_48_11]HCM68633.1 hypothetical protein [Candidatus Kerfeldbacteria bacterium]